MNVNITKLKYLIEEYEVLYGEVERMSEDWENGDACAGAMSDPSDQYMKGMELEDKYIEIKKTLGSL